MERWRGRVAVVTGASAGIGAAIAEDLVDSGMVVVGIARREDRLQELKNKLKGKSGTLHPLKADITKEEEIKAAFKWVKDTLGKLDILINNAGIFMSTLASEGKIEEWQRMLNVNVIALGACTREALNLMTECHVLDGHIVNINSVASHRIGQLPGVGPYSATKFASKAITESVRRELAAQNSKIKVSSISPGVVKTEIFEANSTSIVDFNKINAIEAKDIADAVHYVIATPPNVQVCELIIRPVGDGY